jgi:hypothetical protein
VRRAKATSAGISKQDTGHNLWTQKPLLRHSCVADLKRKHRGFSFKVRFADQVIWLGCVEYVVGSVIC